MVAVVRPENSPSAAGNRLRVLYVGPHADEIRPVFRAANDLVAPAYANSAEEALFMSRNFDFEAVVIDQRDEALATRLILPLVASFDRPVKLVVISALNEAEAYRKIPGIARIIPVPIRDLRVMRALGLDHSKSKVGMADVKTFIPAPMHQRKRRSNRSFNFSAIHLPQFNQTVAYSISFVVAAALTFAVFSGLLARDSGRPVAEIAVNASGNQAELAKVALRIKRAQREKKQADTAYLEAQAQIVLVQSEVREKLNQVNNLVIEHDRKIGVIAREYKFIKTEKKWNRSYAELKSRVDNGLMDFPSMQIGVLRVLKNDERLAELKAEHSLSVATSKNARVDGLILQALMYNLDGKATAIPKPVPAVILPLVKKSALSLARLRDSRKQVEAAAETLDLFQSKRKQLKNLAFSMEGTAIVDGLAMVRHMWQNH